MRASDSVFLAPPATLKRIWYMAVLATAKIVIVTSNSTSVKPSSWCLEPTSIDRLAIERAHGDVEGRLGVRGRRGGRFDLDRTAYVDRRRATRVCLSGQNR